MTAYYNEFDPAAAAWLRELIAAGLIAPGEVDERSIEDVRPSDLRGFTQCHFFAGIGVWSYALRRAGWPDDRPVWTRRRCPPFSSAGKRQVCPDCGSKRNLCHPRRTGYFVCLDCGCSRYADERHLWPELSRLIRECRPSIVLGEQVASADGRLWLDVVSADLRLASYGVGGADFCAASVGSPNIRQRLYWLAHAVRSGLEGHGRHGYGGREPGRIASGSHGPVATEGAISGLADAASPGWRPERQDGDASDRAEAVRAGATQSGRRGATSRLADAACGGRREERSHGRGELVGDRPEGIAARLGDGGGDHRPGPTNGFWRDADWLGCRDGKWRPVEPGTFPLAHGAPARVGRLRGYGNAINAAQAQAFIEAALDIIDARPGADPVPAGSLIDLEDLF